MVPAAHIVLYLASLFYATPLLIACILGKGRKEAKPVMIAWAVLIVLMIPSALGRCDPGHVITGGLGAILLMFALLGGAVPGCLPHIPSCFS